MYKILIVEDDIDLKEGLEFALKEDGYEVLVAETKKDAIICYKSHNFDLVLMAICQMDQVLSFALIYVKIQMLLF